MNSGLKGPFSAKYEPKGPFGSHSRPHRVVVLALEPVIGFDMAIPPMVFGAANGGGVHPGPGVNVQPVAGVEVQPAADGGIQPAGDGGVQPAAGIEVQPAGDGGAQPAADVGAQPAADVGIQPAGDGGARLAANGEQKLYDVQVCGVTDDPVDTPDVYAVHPSHGPSALSTADTVVVPGTRYPAVYRGEVPDDLAAALASIPAGARVMSICTGAFVLAAAGLLDGRPATTHWAHADRFRTLFPQVKLDEDVLFVDDGDVLTSAGLAAGVDLCLHVIRLDHGSAVANRAARHCVVPPWRDGGQSQFIDRQVPDAGDDGTAPTRAWILERLDEPLDLAAMAEHARMSVRTFSRRFRSETGMPPGNWLTQQRIRHARHLLETTDLTVDDVAEAAGLGTAASLRQHLRATIGVSPLAYRRTFRAR